MTTQDGLGDVYCLVLSEPFQTESDVADRPYQSGPGGAPKVYLLVPVRPSAVASGGLNCPYTERR
jgi:hypothetical protein